MKKPLKKPKVLWGLCISTSAHTPYGQRCLERPEDILHTSPAPAVLPLPRSARSRLSSAFWTKQKWRQIFPPHSSCCQQPQRSLVKSPVLTWKTRVEGSCQELSSPPQQCDNCLHEVLIHAASFAGTCGQKLSQGVTPRLQHAVALQPLLPPRKNSINYRNGPNPSSQCLLNVTSCFWKYSEA